MTSCIAEIGWGASSLSVILDICCGEISLRKDAVDKARADNDSLFGDSIFLGRASGDSGDLHLWVWMGIITRLVKGEEAWEWLDDGVLK